MFTGWTSSIIINLLSTVIAFILGIIFNSVFDNIRKKAPVRSFWDGCLKSSVNIIIPSWPADYEEQPLRTGHSDLLAAARAASLLSSFHNRREEIKILEGKYAAQDRLEENVILIGGPVTNEITRRIMQEFEMPFSFADHILLDNRHNKKYEAKADENECILEDYGFVLKTKNPYNDQKSLVIIAGCYGYGTYSGAVAITDYGILRDIIRQAKAESIGLIVKSHIIHEIPQKPFLVEVF